MINVRFRKTAPNPYIGRDEFRFGGTGAEDDWDAVRQGVHEVHEAALGYLSGLDDDDLDVVIPSDAVASWAPDLQEPPLRIAALILGLVARIVPPQVWREHMTPRGSPGTSGHG